MVCLAIAFVIYLTTGGDPINIKYDEKIMRSFLLDCVVKQDLAPHSSIRLGQPARADRRVNNKGRPRKLFERDERRVLRSVPDLRRSEGSFTSRRLQAKPGSLPMIATALSDLV